jgi:hypothetical protein
MNHTSFSRLSEGFSRPALPADFDASGHTNSGSASP